jgi:uncharacterized protein YndB with AHSA1/START domain
MVEMVPEVTLAKTEVKAEAAGRILVTRIFDAPRERVFKAITDPKRIPHWWGPRAYTTMVDKMDVRPGGSWRFVQRDADGREEAFHGVYHTILPSKQLAYTFEWEGLPGHVLFETVTLEDLPGGRTRMLDSLVFQTVEDRDGMLQTGMEGGASESTERLAELLRSG